MNNFFNFTIPYFNSQFGEDWDDFNSITEENVDYVVDKTWQLYWLKRIDTLPIIALDYAIKLRGIEVDADDTIALKKFKLRKFNTTFKDKGASSFYLDYQEAIVGTRGTVYDGLSLGSSVWGRSIWPSSSIESDTEWVWVGSSSLFNIFIDVKTTDSDLLDDIVAVYRQRSMLPAFYKIFLIDSSFTILRSV